MQYFVSNDELYHHGVMGMKWGYRKYQNSDGSLTNAGKKRYQSMDTIVSKKTSEALYIGKRKIKSKSDIMYDIVKDGKKVGDLMLEKHGKDLYCNWVGIKKKERGKGYADSVMDYAIKYASENNFKTMSLEVPGSSQDARHIYEKHGFQKTKSINSDVWDGLTYMKKTL